MAKTPFIGQLARACGVRVTTIRFYERRGLLPNPSRGESGYRLYGEADFRRLRFIQEAKTLGFSLEEIAELLALRAASDTSCSRVRDRAVGKIGDVEKKIRQLQQFRTALRHLVAQCERGGTDGDCPILQAMEHAAGAPHSKDGRRTPLC